MEIQNQITTENTAANKQAVADEKAIEQLLIDGVADFSVGEIELDDVLLDISKNELIIPILWKLITGDMTAITELRLLAKGVTNERILELADSSH